MLIFIYALIITYFYFHIGPAVALAVAGILLAFYITVLAIKVQMEAPEDAKNINENGVIVVEQIHYMVLNISEPQGYGKRIGTFDGQPIYDWVVLNDEKYHFNRIEQNPLFDVDQDEILVAHRNLLYKKGDA